MESIVDKQAVKHFLLQLQDKICQQLEATDGQAQFIEDAWQREPGEKLGGGGRTRVMREGAVFEQGGVNFSHVFGEQMPASATAHRPELAGRRFEAMGVSLVMHPKIRMFRPLMPMCAFLLLKKRAKLRSGGLVVVLTLRRFIPLLRMASTGIKLLKISAPLLGQKSITNIKHGVIAISTYHTAMKHAASADCFLMISMNGHSSNVSLICRRSAKVIPSLCADCRKTQNTPFTERERQFQLYRRGRYVEFNLVLDRGTLFGLQTGGRTESILMSMPPLARWEYAYQPQAGTPEAKLSEFLVPREW